MREDLDSVLSWPGRVSSQELIHVFGDVEWHDCQAFSKLFVDDYNGEHTFESNFITGLENFGDADSKNVSRTLSALAFV